MKRALLTAGVAILLAVAGRAAAPTLPPAADRRVDFAKDIKPLFEKTCIKCHAKGRDKGGFSMETRASFLKGGDMGPAVVPGKSAESYIIELLTTTDADEVMPKKGTRWTREQVGLLRAWIDQGMPWDPALTLAKPPPENLVPRPEIVVAGVSGPGHSGAIDRLLASYFAEHKITPAAPVADHLFARRVYLDTIGLLPSPAELDAFLADTAPDRRARLVRTLLADRRGYADHWLTFWNDLLRNDYRGTGFIDGGRRQISRWLYSALVENKPYDRFVAELIAPSRLSEGFTHGIIWRGTVNASMQPPMQAAQNIAQVFMGVNLKCASCHDSFTSDWTLADAYGLAAIYSDEPLELVHCDKPTGKNAAMRFLYPQLGALDEIAAKPARTQRLAEIITGRENGRLSRTIVNRFWARLFGRGLVEPIDDMEKPAWSRELLDWLAEDLVAHKFDLKHTLELILTSRAYQLPTTAAPGEKEAFVFRGPLARRLTAEQFSDALSSLGDSWERLPATLEIDFASTGLAGEIRLPKWVWTDEPLELAAQRAAARTARAQLETAMRKLAQAQQKADAAAVAGGTNLDEASELATQANADLRNALQQLAAAPRASSPVASEADRHRVIFRKKFTLPDAPAEAFAAILASQRHDVWVNGREAKPKLRDGARNGRIGLIDVKPFLVAGENVIAIDVSSHTEKSMNDIERAKYPTSATHLNAQSGLAFYIRATSAGGKTLAELATDETWRVRRNPDGAWKSADLPDAAWAAAQPLPANAMPIDEGPGLPPINRRDFANRPVELGPQLLPAVSTAAQPGRIRASLLAADPLQLALDRPNREQITPLRPTAATTLQALELTNGATLDTRLKTIAARLAPAAIANPSQWFESTFRHALSRSPTPAQRAAALARLGENPTPDRLAEFLWALAMLPEFQLID